MFTIINGGYIPLTDLEAVCGGSTTIAGNRFGDLKAYFGHFADYLGHGGTVTAPCFRLINLGNTDATIPGGSTLNVTVTLLRCRFTLLSRIVMLLQGRSPYPL
jgi:hypothetical protein